MKENNSKNVNKTSGQLMSKLGGDKKKVIVGMVHFPPLPGWVANQNPVVVVRHMRHLETPDRGRDQHQFVRLRA